MRIEVKYESSQGPHLVDLSENVLEQMIDSGDLSFTEVVGNEGNTKTTTIQVVIEKNGYLPKHY